MNDVVGCVGLGLLSAGLWLIHMPTCFVVVGALLLVVYVAGETRGT